MIESIGMPCFMTSMISPWVTSLVDRIDEMVTILIGYLSDFGSSVFQRYLNGFKFSADVFHKALQPASALAALKGKWRGHFCVGDGWGPLLEVNDRKLKTKI